MNFRQVEAFKAIMESGTVTGAAERMHVSQPAVSKLLAQLERDLGFPVFDRVRGRLVPTAEARAFYDQVDRAFISIEQLSRFARDLGDLKRGHLVVGVMPALSNRWIPEVVARFLRGRDRVTVSVQTRSSIKVLEWVAAQQVDVGLALLTSNEPTVASETLMRLGAVCVLPPGHRLAAKRWIVPEDLEDEPFISLSTLDQSRIKIDRIFESAGVRRRVRVDTVLATPACAFVAQGVGVSIVDPLTAAEHGDRVVVRPFRPEIAFEISLMRPLHRPRSALADIFAAELRRRVAEDRAAAGGRRRVA